MIGRCERFHTIVVCNALHRTESQTENAQIHDYERGMPGFLEMAARAATADG